MKRDKPAESQGSQGFLGDMGISEEERRQAMIGVITNVAAFAAVVLALRVGKEVTVQC